MKPKNSVEPASAARIPVGLFPSSATPSRLRGPAIDPGPQDALPSLGVPRVACGPSAAVRADHVRVLVDELAARLAFERVGVRLYDALLARLDRQPTPAVPRAEVAALRREEAAHASLAQRTIRHLGGDPGAVLSANDVYATAMIGAPERIEDPGTELQSCLDSVLRVELADQDGWTVLLALARLLGREDLVRRFERALEKEHEHLRTVRRWMSCVRAASAATRPPAEA